MIIDFHVHTFPDKIAPKAVGKLAVISGITPFTDGTVGDTIAKMDVIGIDVSVCLNIATRPGQERTINDTAARLFTESGGRLVGFGSVHPDSPDAVEELSRCKEIGLKGIKLHPDYEGFMVDDAKLWPRLGLLQPGSYSLPPGTGRESRQSFSAPSDVFRAFRRNEDVG